MRRLQSAGSISANGITAKMTLEVERRENGAHQKNPYKQKIIITKQKTLYPKKPYEQKITIYILEQALLKRATVKN
jgi:hypothetical protein